MYSLKPLILSLPRSLSPSLPLSLSLSPKFPGINTQVNRDYEIEYFYLENPVVKDLVEYKFEKHDKDSVTMVSKDHGAEIFLDKDARKWATRLVKHQTSIESFRKQIKGLRSVTTAYTKVRTHTSLFLLLFFPSFICSLSPSLSSPESQDYY